MSETALEERVARLERLVDGLVEQWNSNFATLPPAETGAA